MLTFSQEEATQIVRDEHPDFTVVEKNAIDQSKGISHFEVIVKNIKTNRYYRSFYHVGYRAVNNYDVFPFDREEPVFYEVKLREVVVQVWDDIE